LYNAGIILNNKLATEIVRVFYEHGIYDLNNDIIFRIISNYLIGLKDKAKKELDEYFRDNMYVVDDFSKIKSPYHLGLFRYNEITNKIFDFDMVDDFFDALTTYLFAYINETRKDESGSMFERILDLQLSLFDTLNKLGLYSLYEASVKHISNTIFPNGNKQSDDETYLEKTK
jgi:hypothetical protein